MNVPSTSGFRVDARPTPRITAVCMMVAGGLLALFGPQAAFLYILALWLVVAGFTGLYIATLNPTFAPYVVICGLIVSIFLAQIWLNGAALLWVLFLPTALAAVFINVRTSFAIGCIETVLVAILALLQPVGAIQVFALQALFAIWATISMMRAVYLPIYQILDWGWERYQTVEQTLEEIRNQRKVSQQTLQDLEHANRQLELTNKRLAAFRAMAEDAQQSKAAFVAKVSHEFRTPLNIIIGLTSLLLEDNATGTQPTTSTLVNDLKVIRRNCAYLSDLVNDVLDLSRAEAGYLTLQKEWVDLLAIIESAVELVKPLVEKKQLNLIIDRSQDLPLVYCDRVRIRQVILNLVGNAVRFTDVGSITVNAQKRGNQVEISVKDTGVGIKPEDQPRVFEPFCQSSNNPWQEKGGTGLGLSISRQFIELHHGRMSFETELGLGTTFSFIIPISPIEEPVESSIRWIDEAWIWRQRASQTVRANPALELRVVVFDQLGSLEREPFEYADNIEIVYTRDLEELAAMLRLAPAHAIMINSEGYEDMWQTVEQVRTMIPDTPITAFSVPYDYRQRAHDYEALDYLEKPVTRERLMEAIKRMGRVPRRILIADDDPDMRWLLARMLEADSEVEVATAANGEDTLEELRFGSPDLMLLDIMMPNMDGWEVLERKAADAILAPIPVILITGQGALQPPPVAQFVLMTTGDGIPLDKLIKLSLQHSALLSAPDQRSGLV